MNKIWFLIVGIQHVQCVLLKLLNVVCVKLRLQLESSNLDNITL